MLISMKEIAQETLFKKIAQETHKAYMLLFFFAHTNLFSAKYENNMFPLLIKQTRSCLLFYS